jgi:hypothetical protein
MGMSEGMVQDQKAVEQWQSTTHDMPWFVSSCTDRTTTRPEVKSARSRLWVGSPSQKPASRQDTWPPSTYRSSVRAAEHNRNQARSGCPWLWTARSPSSKSSDQTMEHILYGFVPGLDHETIPTPRRTRSLRLG